MREHAHTHTQFQNFYKGLCVLTHVMSTLVFPFIQWTYTDSLDEPDTVTPWGWKNEHDLVLNSREL